MSFPDSWSEDCPPSQALACNGSFFHIIKQNPAGADDCRTFHEKGQRPTHHTWWPSVECDRPSRITLIEEVA